MILPSNGKIVIIDDKYDEVKKLIQALSANGVSFSYFQDETGEDLPAQPIENIRLVFLDLVLQVDIGNAPPKAIVSSALSRLIRIIGEDNGPYFLLVWSTEYEKYFDILQEEMEKEAFFSRRPISIIPLEKRKLTGANIDALSRVIENALKENDALKAFLFLESLVNNAIGKHTNNFLSLVKKDQWNSDAKNLLFKLSYSYWGKYYNKLTTQRDKVLGAYFTLSQTFIDVVDSTMENSYHRGLDGILQPNGSNDENFYARINEQLHIANYSLDHNSPGCVYFPILASKERLLEIRDRRIATEKRIREHSPRGGKMSSISKFGIKYREEVDAVKKIIKEKEKIFHSIVCDSLFLKYDRRRKTLFKENHYLELNISPICDHAQEKIKTIRMLPGILVPSSRKNWFNKDAQFNYISDFCFNFQGGAYFLLFDHRFLYGIKPGSPEYKPSFRLKEKLLNDVQSKLSSHVSRGGLLYMS